MKPIIIVLIIAAMLSAFLPSCKKDNSGDGIPPQIVILGLNPLYWAKDVPYEDSGAIAYDISSTGDTIDITQNIVVQNNVDVSAEGEYSVKYNVKDESGMSADEKVRKVVIVIGK